MSSDHIWPILFFVSLAGNLILLFYRPLLRLLRRGEEVSEDEIMAMVEEGEESGAIERNEKELIENVFEFNNTTAEDVMIHRTDMVTLSLDDDEETILSAIRESGLSRFPVYQGNVDDIVGILSTRQYLLNFHVERPQELRALLRPAYFVPETVRADVLFRDMQSKKIHMAVVVDEYGGTEGIIMNIADMKRLEEEYKKLSKNSGMGGGSVVMYGGSSGTKVKGYDQVYVKVDDVNHVGAVEQMIKDIGYQTSSMTQYREDMQKQVASGQMMLGGLAAVSLLVAALNIANTMTMAIYERTKEIGVMKVLGCKLSKIRQMFLIESGTIGFIGGVIGCLFSVLISFVLNNFTVWMQAITGWLMSIGVQVNFDASSFDVGALFGMGGMGGMY